MTVIDPHLTPAERLVRDSIFGALLPGEPPPEPSRLPAVSVVARFGMFSRLAAVERAETYANADPFLQHVLDYRAHRLSDGRWGVTRRVLPADGDNRIGLHLPYSHTFRLDGGEVRTLDAVDGWGGTGRRATADLDDVIQYSQERGEQFEWTAERPDLLVLTEKDPGSGERASGYLFAVRLSQLDLSYRLLGAVRNRGTDDPPL